ncbi:MAG: class I SAM-dependent methyltransferase [Treponema sp.]|nr:class I SAM-dependent methyltransferase [Treponema sp.]
MNNRIKPDVLHSEQFPRSNEYDPTWIFDNEMGPHPLWLAEYLTLAFDLKPGMRVLDLACGKGMTSVFLAREFVVQVYAVDLWDDPEEKWKNAKAFGVEHLICPIQADAKNLPFAQGFFDAIICINSFMYFGLDDAYLENILKFLRPGGQLGMIVTGFMKDVTNGVPEYLQRFLGDELWTWQTLPWYRNLWEKTGLVSINAADTLPNGCELWLRYDKALFESGKSRWSDESHYFLTDKGEYMGFIRLVATKK